jgi:hypothetical protein
MKPVIKITNDLGFKEELSLDVYLFELFEWVAFDKMLEIKLEKDQYSICLYQNDNGRCTGKVISFQNDKAIELFFNEYYQDMVQSAKECGIELKCISGIFAEYVQYQNESYC